MTKRVIPFLGYYENCFYEKVEIGTPWGHGLAYYADPEECFSVLVTVNRALSVSAASISKLSVFRTRIPEKCFPNS